METRRAQEIKPFIVMDILERALELEREGRAIVHLEVGEPDFDVPEIVKESMLRAVREGETHYTHSLGIWPLREAIAARYADRYGVDVTPDRVVVTAGTSGAFLLLFGALFEPGDGVLVADPGYPCYPNFARFVGAVPRPVPVDAADGFALCPQRVRAALDAAPARGIVVSSPANPTGTVTPRAVFDTLADLPLVRISDELYHGLRYEPPDGSAAEPEFTALAVDPDAIVVDGFSKRYAMTGLRVGWTVVPQALVRPLNRLSQNLFISVSSIAQRAALAALNGADADVARMVTTYAERNRVLIAELRRLGFHVEVPPVGAFYVFARMSHLYPDSYEFCRRMLEEAGVAATPGRDFGAHRTHEYVRFAYTRSVDTIREGMRRLAAWLPGLQPVPPPSADSSA